MYTDVCEITPITRDANLGLETSGTAFRKPCKVEQEDYLRPTSNGVVKIPQRLFLLPPDTSIYTGDNIRIISISNMPVSESINEVDKVFPVGYNMVHHLEVTIK